MASVQSSASRVVEQAVGVRGDAHHPLPHVPLEHRVVAPVATTLGGDLLVGHDGPQSRAPVDRRIRHVGQAVTGQHLTLLGGAQVGPRTTIGGVPLALSELVDQLTDRSGSVGLRVVPRVEDGAEDPLGPPIVRGVGGLDAAPAVVAQAEAVKLAAHVRHVLGGGDRRVLAGLDCILLGRETKGVEAHAVEHISAPHALKAAEDVGTDISEWMPHMEPAARRVGEHVEHEQLLAPIGHPLRIGQRTAGVGCLEQGMFVPVRLPPKLDLLGHGRVVTVRRRVVVVSACVIRGHRGRGIRVRRLDLRCGGIGHSHSAYGAQCHLRSAWTSPLPAAFQLVEQVVSADDPDENRCAAARGGMGGPVP